jgi:imidazolonepropionase-like amidohydrolase
MNTTGDATLKGSWLSVGFYDAQIFKIMKTSFLFFFFLSITLAVAPPFAQAQTGARAIQNVTIIDVVKGRAVPNQTVVWQNGKILYAGTASKAVLPQGTTTQDGTGKFIVPGLVDAHIHFFQSGGLYTRPDGLDFRFLYPYEKDQTWIKANHADLMKRYLACGVTGIVDVGGPFYNFKIRDSVNKAVLAPHTVVTGPLISTYAPPNLDEKDPPIIKANTPEEARKLVQNQLPYSPAFIKIWFVILPDQKPEQFQEVVRAAIDEAHKNNLRVAVHATEYATAKKAVELGADILVHSVDDAVLEDDFLKVLKQKKIVYIPTLQVMQQFYRMATQQFNFTMHELTYADPTQLGSLMDLQHLDPKQIGGLDYKALRARFAVPSKADSFMLVNLKRVADAGITIATGTDAGNPGVAHGASYLRELVMMKQAGLTAAQVLQASTINAAAAFGQQTKYGTVEQGKNADFLVLAENPLDKIEALGNIEAVWLGGTMYNPASLLPKTVETLANAEVAAYNAGNIEVFISRYAPEAEIYMLTDPHKPFAKGRQQIKEIWGDMFKQLPNLHCHVTSRTIVGNTCTAIESITGIGTDKPVTAVGIYFFNLQTGLIDKVYFIQ